MTDTPLPYELPSYTTLSSPAFVWSENVDGADFTQMISAAYTEVVHWQHNLFLTPSGKVGKRFTSELARLFRAYDEGSGLEPIALKAAMVMHYSFKNRILHQKPMSMWCVYNDDLILGKWVTSTISLSRDAPYSTASNRITGTHTQ